MFIVDCDCHSEWHSAEILLPYLEGWWRDCFERGERTGPKGAFPHAHRAWFHPEDFRRADVKPESEEDVYFQMRDKHLNPNKIDVAVLTCEEGLEVSTLANPHYAAALARANNDWEVNEWLPLDERFAGSIIIAPQDPQLAAQEIYRLGEHPRMVQVLASHGAILPYGDPYYHPIYRACEEVGLPFAIHLGGNGGINTATFAGGSPRYYSEAHALLTQPAHTHLASMIFNGVFERFPDLYFVVIECGFTWVPPLLWRMDSEWRSLRKETPWVKKLPSDYFRQHVRFTTQPIDEPDKVEYLWSLMEAMDAKNTLMFASDYPHWDQDDPKNIRLPEGWHDDIFGLNALKTYKRLSHLMPQQPQMAAGGA